LGAPGKGGIEGLVEGGFLEEYLVWKVVISALSVSPLKFMVVPVENWAEG